MKIFENVPLSSITYYHIGGMCRYVLKVGNKTELLEAISFLHHENIKQYLLLGLGSNVVFSDRDFNGAVIWLEGDGNSLESSS